jgi:hypothetical protein
MPALIQLSFADDKAKEADHAPDRQRDVCIIWIYTHFCSPNPNKISEFLSCSKITISRSSLTNSQKFRKKHVSNQSWA